MRGFLRRARGALGTALVWASTWFVAGLGLAAVTYVGFEVPIPFWRFVLGAARNFAGMGFIAGGGFSLYLGIAGRRKRLEDLRPLRFGLGGALVAGLLVPVLHAAISLGTGVPILSGSVLAVASALSALIGGVTAVSTLRIAQGAPLALSAASSPDPEAALTAGHAHTSLREPAIPRA
jgi:hypothetical protein